MQPTKSADRSSDDLIRKNENKSTINASSSKTVVIQMDVNG